MFNLLTVFLSQAISDKTRGNIFYYKLIVKFIPNYIIIIIIFFSHTVNIYIFNIYVGVDYDI